MPQNLENIIFFYMSYIYLHKNEAKDGLRMKLMDIIELRRSGQAAIYILTENH